MRPQYHQKGKMRNYKNFWVFSTIKKIIKTLKKDEREMGKC
jgi:hypothetical protein